MKLCDALKDKLLDLRLRDKLLAEGKLTKDQVDKYLLSLEDSSDSLKLVEIPEMRNRVRSVSAPKKS